MIICLVAEQQVPVPWTGKTGEYILVVPVFLLIYLYNLNEQLRFVFITNINNLL